MTKVLIVFSAKGGVGKTTVSVGVANELANRGHKVALLDMDTTTPNAHPKDGITLISKKSNSTPTRRSISSLLSKAAKAKADYLVIDTPPTISETILTISNMIKPTPQVLYVSTPSENAIEDTASGVRFLTSRGANSIGVVQNMVGEDFGQEFDSLSRLGLPTIGSIPLSSNRMDELFESIVDKTLPLLEPSAISTFSRVMSTLTVAQAEADERLPVKFYNIDTWELMREKLVSRDLMLGSVFGAIKEDDDKLEFKDVKSHFDVPTEKIARIIKAGESVLGLVVGSLAVVGAPPMYAIEEFRVEWDGDISKGLPLLRSRDGALLWPNEIAIVTDDLIQSEIKEGLLVEMTSGVYAPTSFAFINNLRAMNHVTSSREIVMLSALLEYSGEELKKEEFFQFIAVKNGYITEDKFGIDYLKFLEALDEEQYGELMHYQVLITEKD